MPIDKNNIIPLECPVLNEFLMEKNKLKSSPKIIINLVLGETGMKIEDYKKGCSQTYTDCKYTSSGEGECHLKLILTGERKWCEYDSWICNSNTKK